MDHKRRALSVVLGTLLLSLGVHGAAQASLIPTLGSISPGSSGFIWSYNIALAADQNATGGPSQSDNPVLPSATVGDFLTVYDFRGFVSGSCFAPTGWACQTQGLGFTPNTQTPADNPSLTNLSFTRTVLTANGRASAAPLRIPEIRLGSIVRTNVEAVVLEEGLLDQSLLGMSFLSTLSSMQMQTDELRLRD